MKEGICWSNKNNIFILIINARIWTTYLLFVEHCMHLVYQEIHLKSFLYMWTIKCSKNRKHYYFLFAKEDRCLVLQEVEGESFLRENWFEMSDLFSSLLIFTIIKTILSTFYFFTVSKFTKNLVKWALTEMKCSVAGTTTLDREC
jgi:hypothetical protein